MARRIKYKKWSAWTHDVGKLRNGSHRKGKSTGLELNSTYNGVLMKNTSINKLKCMKYLADLIDIEK